MASLNKVFLIGNLTRDPELRYIPSGTAVAEMRLAVSQKYRTKSGEDRDDTVFVDVVVWDRQAENCSKYLSKGSPLMVEGRLKLDEWEKDGQKQSKLRVVAERTQFLGSPRRGEYSDGPAETESAPSRQDASRSPAPPEASRRSVDETDNGDGPPDDIAGDDDNLPF